MKFGQLNIPNVFVKNGIFYFNKMIKGKRHKVSLRTTDPIEAYNIVKKYNDELIHIKIRKLQNIADIPSNKAEQKIIKIDDRPTLIQAFNDHIKVCKLNNQTIDRIKGKEKMKQTLINKKWTWDKLTHENILDFQGRIQKDFKPHTAYKKIGYLKGFVNYCLEVGYYNYDSYKRIKWMPRPPRTGVQVKIVSEDLQKILNYLIENNDLNFLNFVMIQLVTVSRMGEIRDLKLEHLDPNNEEIRIFQDKVSEPKISQVPLHILNSLKQLAKINNHPEGYIFYQSKNRDFYASEFRKIKKELNLRKEYILPKLRHTAISYVAEHYGLIVAQQMAGHKSHHTTASHYYVPDTKYSRKASESMITDLLVR